MSIEKNTLSAEIQTTLMSWIQSTILSLDSQHNLVAYNYSGKRKGDMLDFWIWNNILSIMAMAKNYLTPFLTEDIHGTEIIQALNLANLLPIQEFNRKKLHSATDKIWSMPVTCYDLCHWKLSYLFCETKASYACSQGCLSQLMLQVVDTLFRLMWEYDPWWLPVGHQFV